MNKSSRTMPLILSIKIRSRSSHSQILLFVFCLCRWKVSFPMVLAELSWRWFSYKEEKSSTLNLVAEMRLHLSDVTLRKALRFALHHPSCCNSFIHLWGALFQASQALMIFIILANGWDRVIKRKRLQKPSWNHHGSCPVHFSKDEIRTGCGSP